MIRITMMLKKKKPNSLSGYNHYKTLAQRLLLSGIESSHINIQRLLLSGIESSHVNIGCNQCNVEFNGSDIKYK